MADNRIQLTDGELSNLLWTLEHTSEHLRAQMADPTQANALGLLEIKLAELCGLRNRLSIEYACRTEIADYEASQRRILEDC